MSLPYSADILYALYGQINRSVWPLHVGAYLLTLIALLHAARPVPSGDRAVGLLLAAGWAWVAWHFFYLAFASLNFMAPLYGAAFALQAALLAVYGALGRIRPRLGGDLWSAAGLVLIGLALGGLPLLDVVLGHALPETPLVWIAPDPSALATLGLLLLCPRPPAVLALVPLAWGLVAGVSAWALDMPAGLAASAAAIGGAGAVAARWAGPRFRT